MEHVSIDQRLAGFSPQTGYSVLGKSVHWSGSHFLHLWAHSVYASEQWAHSNLAGAASMGKNSNLAVSSSIEDAARPNT